MGMLIGYVTAFMGSVGAAPPANSKYTKIIDVRKVYPLQCLLIWI